MASLFTKRNLLADFAAGLAEGVLVRNVIGSSEYPNECCDSWLDHCRRAATSLPPLFCSAVGCGKVAALGGHVIMVRNPDRSWRIVPLCDDCNGLERAYEIYAHVQLVPATRLRSCRR